MADKNPVGRPTVKTDEVIRKIEEVAALDGSVEEMAYYAGIHRDTLYAWLKDDKDLSDRIQALRERPILKARQTIAKSLDDPKHAQWYVERKRKKEFGPGLDLTSEGERIQFTLIQDVAGKYTANRMAEAGGSKPEEV